MRVRTVLGVPLLTFTESPVAMGLLAVFVWAYLMLLAAILICVVQMDGGAVGAWVCFCLVQVVCIVGQAMSSYKDGRYYLSNFLEQLQIGSAVVVDGALNPLGPLEELIARKCGCCTKKKEIDLQYEHLVADKVTNYGS